jgi:lipoprotein-releasing system ATP-binding protein
MVSIRGRSGAGKSTLLHLLATLDKPTEGRILFGDEDVFRFTPMQRARFRNEHIGLMFQFHHLLSEFTALENVMMPALIAGESRREAEGKAVELLSQLGLSKRMEHKPSELSGGEKQRVAAARAMIMQPDIILADEPSGSLDEQNKRELHQLLLRLKEQFGQTILIVTYDKELAQISDRVIEIQDGKIL